MNIKVDQLIRVNVFCNPGITGCTVALPSSCVSTPPSLSPRPSPRRSVSRLFTILVDCFVSSRDPSRNKLYSETGRRLFRNTWNLSSKEYYLHIALCLTATVRVAISLEFKPVSPFSRDPPQKRLPHSGRTVL